MHSIDIATLGGTAASLQTSRRTAWTDAGNAQTADDESPTQARLWKLTSTVHSPLKRGLQTGLFLIISSLGFSVIAYSIDQFATFFHHDSLTQTITLLLR